MSETDNIEHTSSSIPNEPVSSGVFVGDDRVANREFIAAATEEELKRCLLVGMDTGDFSPLLLSDEPSVQAQLQLLTDGDSLARENLKRAVFIALNQVPLKNVGNNLSTLTQLALLAGYIRATEVTPILHGAIKWLRYLPSTPAVSEAISIMIRVLAGFAPEPKVVRTLHTLFFDDGFDSRYSDRLFIGLCMCRPDQYPRYLARFIALSRPHHFRIDLIMREFVRVVGLFTISEHSQELERYLSIWLSKTVKDYVGINLYPQSKRSDTLDQGRNLPATALTGRPESFRPITSIAMSQADKSNILSILERTESDFKQNPASVG